MKNIIRIGLLSCLISANSHAQTILPDTGNLLISTDKTIFEYTIDGNYVQSLSTEYPGGYPSTEYSRDIAADIYGNVYLYNGTFHPYMSIYDSVNSQWSHMIYDAFNTVNNGSYGGIDIYTNTLSNTNTIFVSDMFTYSGGESKGVVAFNTTTGETIRFAQETEPIDLTLGLNGLLYTLAPGGSPGGRNVSIYNPLDFEKLGDIDLTNTFGWTEHRSIAVDQNGDIFIADWDGEVHHIDKTGELIDTIIPICDWIGRNINCNFIDIDISVNGEIALGTRFGEIFLTDTTFSSIYTFDVGLDNTFVEFVPTYHQEPPDADGDGIPNDIDNCIMDINPDQYDSDYDGTGDACDVCAFDPEDDIDLDGHCGDVDNCPDVPNNYQSDLDRDGIGDLCDICVLDPDNNLDMDDHCGDVDNCPDVSNNDQSDLDNDGIGDACDNDADNDGFTSADDCNDFDININPSQCDIKNDGVDQDCDGVDRTKGKPCVDDGGGTEPLPTCSDYDGDEVACDLAGCRWSKKKLTCN